jgi:hypothetical protein
MRCKPEIAAIAFAAACALAPPAAAQTGDRLTDNDVKQLVERVDQARDRFEDQLDGKLKNSVYRNATGEIDVKASLDDFQKETDRLKSRLTPTYGAGAEVASMLRRGNVLAALMKEQPGGTKGANEWDQLASELRRLAGAYGAAFPTPEGAAVRRISDGEAGSTAGSIAAAAEQAKRAVSSDKALPKPQKEALAADLDALAKQAKTLQSRLKDGKPASADARAVREKVEALTANGRQVPAGALTAIGAMRAPLEKLDQAFTAGPASR